MERDPRGVNRRNNGSRSTQDSRTGSQILRSRLRETLYPSQHLLLRLGHQALELCVVKTEGMLSEARLFPYHVPVGHPVKLQALPRPLQHNQEGIVSHFL